MSWRCSRAAWKRTLISIPRWARIRPLRMAAMVRQSVFLIAPPAMLISCGVAFVSATSALGRAIMQQAQFSASQADSIARHALGTIAIDIPVILAFLLLLATRPGLPRRSLMLERLNQARMKSGKTRLLDHIEVSSPLLPEYRSAAGESLAGNPRRGPRLHHVRGHLVRRGSQLFWRVPHLRGSARAGIVRSRTVTWTLDSPSEHRPSPG